MARIADRSAEAPASSRAMTRPSIVGTKNAWVARSEAASLSHSSGSKAGRSKNPPHGVDGAQQGRDSGNVVGRHAHQRGLLLAGGSELDGAENVREQVGMPQDRRFGCGRGPAGKELNRDALGRLIRSSRGPRPPLPRRGSRCDLVCDGRGPGPSARCAPHLPRCTRARCAGAGMRDRDRRGDS